MTTSNRFDPKDPGEDDIVLFFDFSAGLGPTQTLVGAPTVTVKVVKGIDASPMALLAGGNTIDATGKIFEVPVIGGLDGVDYDVVVKAQTNNPAKLNQVLGGILPIRAQ